MVCTSLVLVDDQGGKELFFPAVFLGCPGLFWTLGGTSCSGGKFLLVFWSRACIYRFLSQVVLMYIS